MPSPEELNRNSAAETPVPGDKIISAGIRKLEVEGRQVPFGVIEVQRGDRRLEFRRRVEFGSFSDRVQVVVKEAPKQR